MKSKCRTDYKDNQNKSNLWGAAFGRPPQVVFILIIFILSYYPLISFRIHFDLLIHMYIVATAKPWPENPETSIGSMRIV